MKSRSDVLYEGSTKCDMALNMEDLDYEGYLLFNDIRRLSPDIDIEEVVEKLEQHSIQSRDEEIKEVLLPPRALDEPLPKEFFRMMDEDCWWFKYKITEYEEQQGYDEEGELRKIKIPSEQSCDVFITSGGYLLTRGSAADAPEFTNRVIEIIDELGFSQDHEEIEFDSDFLIWLIYQTESPQSQSLDISIERLTDAKVTGKTDIFGQENRVSGSQNVARSAPVLTGILARKAVSMLGGIFRIDDVTLRADITSEGRIHIKVDRDIAHLGSAGRVIAAVQFAQRLCNIYSEWKDGGVQNRYPPDDFFEQTYRNLNDAGIDLTFSIDETLEYYRDKRDE